MSNFNGCTVGLEYLDNENGGAFTNTDDVLHKYAT